MNILLKVILIVLAALLFVISFAVFFPFLNSIGLLPFLVDDVGHSGHGLAKLGYMLDGALFGATVGLMISTYIVFEKNLWIKQFFISLTIFTLIITSIVFISVSFIGVQY